ncbi:hypothetical protein ABMB44_12500 [Levilactobacillus brevis]
MEKYLHFMVLVDIAVPRDIEPGGRQTGQRYLYSVDDLHAIIQSNLAQRKAAAVQAESIVQQESTNFMAWLRSQGAVETIRDYRSQADQIRAEMEAKSAGRHRAGRKRGAGYSRAGP